MAVDERLTSPTVEMVWLTLGRASKGCLKRGMGPPTVQALQVLAILHTRKSLRLSENFPKNQSFCAEIDRDGGKAVGGDGLRHGTSVNPRTFGVFLAAMAVDANGPAWADGGVMPPDFIYSGLIVLVVLF